MTKCKDFDKFFQEVKKEPIVIKVFGEYYNLPAEMPASIMLETAKLQKSLEEDEQVPVDKTFEIAESYFGKEQFEKLIKTGISVNQLGAVIEYVSTLYGGIELKDEEIMDKLKKGLTPQTPNQNQE